MNNERWNGFRHERASFELATFSSSEVAAVAGIPPALLRAWRNRRLLPGDLRRGSGLNSLEMCEVIIRYQLSLSGIPPSESAKISSEAARSTLLLALMTSDGACEVSGQAADIERFVAMWESDARIPTEIAGDPHLYRFLCRGNGGAPFFQEDVQNIILDDGYVAVFFIDLQAVATRLVEVVQRPLVKVEFEMEPGRRRVRRWSSGRASNMSPRLPDRSSPDPT